MNSKRKADLQRKLSLAQVPTPPAGLAERLKNDIPDYFPATTEHERRRLSRSVGFSMRVAASILLMISSVYLTLRFVSRSENRNAEMLPASVPMVTAKPAPPRLEPVAQKQALAPQPTIIVMEGTTVVASKDSTDEAGFAQPGSRLDRRQIVEEKKESFAHSPSPAASNESAAADGAVAPTEFADALSAPKAAFAPPPPRPAPAAYAPTSAAGRMASAVAPMAPAPPLASEEPEQVSVGAMQMAERSRKMAGGASRDLVKSASAADLSFAPPDALFGISVDRRAFDRVKNAIERGERPEATAIDVDALVNYFAGHPAHPPRELQLEAEGSPAPVPLDPLRRIVRFTVDSAGADMAKGASIPPVASDVRLAITFDPSSVASHHRIGGDDVTTASESSLLKNESVTALYEVELRPNLRDRQQIATVRLTYRSVADGRERTIDRKLLREDLARTWVSASRRHRLASLGAVWGETLKGNAGDVEVARRAEELAHQAPNDSKARELADIAGAASRLRNAPTTGSGL